MTEPVLTLAMSSGRAPFSMSASLSSIQGLVVLFLVCQLVFVVVATPDNDEDDDATNDTHNAEDTMIGCYMRSYTYRISKPFIREDGTELECYDDAVTVFTCWGRCDSNEVGPHAFETDTNQAN